MFILGFSVTVFAQDCSIVWPQFGVVSCRVFYGSQPETEFKNPSCSNDICTFTFSCAGKVNCEIDGIDILPGTPCPGIPCLEYSIYGDGQLKGNVFGYGTCPGKNPYSTIIKNFDEVVIEARCTAFVDHYPVEQSSTVTMSYLNNYLYDENPDYPEHKVDESVGCIPQGIMYKTGYSDKLPSMWIDSVGNVVGTKPNDLVDNLPTNMKVGDTKSYFYGWREVPSINIIKNKAGNIGGFCGGDLGSRKLLSYQEITDVSNCYIVPTKIEREVECCYDNDCDWKDPSGGFVCNPESFTCTEEKPCNSDSECEVVGQSTCFNFIETNWNCDFSDPWYPKLGTCKKSTKNVKCCLDSDCDTDQYCNKEEGCKDRYILEECPVGKCCVSGGNYKPRECSTKLECCREGSSFVGICKETCEPVENIQVESDSEIVDSSVIVSGPTGNFLANTTLIGGIIAAITIGSVGFVLWKRKKVNIPTSKVIRKSKPNISSGYCTNCGAKMNGMFCTKCGKGVN